MKLYGEMTKEEQKQIANLIDVEQNVNETKWWFRGMGVELTEKEIVGVIESELRKACRCSDDSGSCHACMSRQYAYYLGNG